VTKIKLNYVREKTARYKDKQYVYYVFIYRRKETRLPGIPGSLEFLRKYEPLLAAAKADKEARGKRKVLEQPVMLPGTLSALIVEYKDSIEYKRLGKSRKENIIRYFTWIGEAWGSLPAAGIRPKNVLALQKKYSHTPATADKVIGALRQLLDFGIPRDYLKTNPADKIKNIYKKPEGYKPWPAFIIKSIVEHPSCTPMLRLAIYLHLYTGQRIQDCTKMQWGHIKRGKVEVASQAKTKLRLLIPLHADLKKELARIEKNSVFVLYGRYNQPFTPDALRTRLRTLLINMGLATRISATADGKPNWEYEYHFHGLRKNAVNTLLEAGTTTAQVSSITGQTMETIEHYAKGINRAALAEDAMGLAAGAWDSSRDG